MYRDTETFSSCNSVVGPFATFPVPLEGDDVSDIVGPVPRSAPDERAHGHHGPPRAHPRAGPAHATAHAEAAQGQRGLHVAPGRPAARRVRGRRSLRVHQGLRPALRHAGGRRRPRGARGGRATVPRGLRPDPHRRRGRRRRGGQPEPQPAGLARRVVRPVHRGPAAPAPRGRAHRPGPGHLPRREHPRRHLGGAHLDLPVRGRAGDDRPPAGRGAQAPGRAPRAAGRAAGRPPTASPTSSRRCCGSRAR